MWPRSAVPRVSLVVALLVLAIGRLAAVPQGVHVSSIAPASGRAGDVVTITGGGFGALNVRLTVGGIPATVLAATGGLVTFVVPAGLKPGIAAVTVTNPGGRSGTIGFQVLGSGLLPGDPATPAIDAIFDLPPVAVGDGDIEGSVIMSRLDVRLSHDATVGEVNAALAPIGGSIASMSRGFRSLTIGVPRQPSVEAVKALVATLRGSPGIGFASPALISSPDELPSTSMKQLDPQLLPTRFPAAWNAKNLVVDDLGGCRHDRVPVLVLDSFLRPAPLIDDGAFNFVTFDSEVPHFLPSPPDETSTETHGNSVTLLLGALFNADARTGANPFSQCLDITAVQLHGLSQVQATDRIAQNFPTGKFIMNYSRSWPKACQSGDVIVACQPSDFGGQIPNAIQRAEDTLWWKHRSHSRWDDFVVATSAGNVRNKQVAQVYPTLGSSPMNSPLNAATLSDPFLRFAEEQGRWEPTDPTFKNLAATTEEMQNLAGAISVLGLDSVSAAPNLLKVGSTSKGADYPDLAGSSFSNTGHDVSAVGEEVLAHDARVIRGTSFAAPQVAGLASYLWLLSPALRAAPADITRRAIIANAINAAQASAVIDAYATILSLDQATAPTPAAAPIRHAVLDTNRDSKFDELDLAAYRLAHLDASGEPRDPVDRDYSRFDLNGDGFTGGPTKTSRFDLDRVGSTQFGNTSYAIVDTQIEGVEVSFNEALLTDLQVLCYYAYSGLYEGTAAGRAPIMDGLCVTPTVTVNPAVVTLSAGATQQFSAVVTGVSDPRVTWSATGGTISDVGLFTAGPTPGPGTVRAISVVDPNAFGDATVTIDSGVTTNVSINVGGGNAPAGHVRVGVLSTGFDLTRPVAEMSSVLSALTQALAGISIGQLTVISAEPVSITFTVGDVRQLNVGAGCGANIDLTVGDVRRHPTSPGLFGNGSIRVVACESNTTIRTRDTEFVQIENSRASKIEVLARTTTQSIFIQGNAQTEISVSGAVPGAFVNLNNEIKVRLGNVGGNLTIERNRLPNRLDDFIVGSIGGNLTIRFNTGLFDFEAQEFADARSVGGTVTILGNTR